MKWSFHNGICCQDPVAATLSIYLRSIQLLPATGRSTAIVSAASVVREIMDKLENDANKRRGLEFEKYLETKRHNEVMEELLQAGSTEYRL
jgi:hypothetical protein